MLEGENKVPLNQQKGYVILRSPMSTWTVIFYSAERREDLGSSSESLLYPAWPWQTCTESERQFPRKTVVVDFAGVWLPCKEWKKDHNPHQQSLVFSHSLGWRNKKPRGIEEMDECCRSAHNRLEERKGTLFKCFVVLALVHWLRILSTEISN